MSLPALPPTDPALRLLRLERRLAREREARLAAEAIAEHGLRDLFVQQQRLKLVETIASAANTGDDPAVVFQLALECICEFTGWPTGHVHMFADDDPGGPLRSSGLWCGAEGETYAAFRAASSTMTFDIGQCLPGRVLASGKASWIEDITVDANFPRASAALACSLRGAVAFPAIMGQEVGAVLEFFQCRPAPPDEELLRTLDQLGAQLGRVIERDRAVRRQRAHGEALTALYEEAQVQRAAAEQASRAKSAFLAVTSHEIRTPLNAVLGLAEALRREPLTPGQRELNDGILASGAMLLRLMNAVLDLSRIEAGRATAQMNDFDIVAKVQTIVSIWTPRAEEMGVALSLDISELAVRTVRTDEGRIEQSLVNLLSNALKFTPRGEQVLLRASSSQDELRLEIIDGGSGVSDADRQRIFEPFEQTDLGREAGGAGLGLAICVGNLTLLGGVVRNDRDERGRNRFWFTCPVAEVQCSPIDVVGETVVTFDRILRVLAAEDHPVNRHVLAVLLQPMDVVLTFAENGQEALDALVAAEYDLILMDANMPIMDGLEAVRRIRAGGGRAAEMPIYMLTANAFVEDVERYLASGADGVLTKPIEIPRLYAVLEACRAKAAIQELAGHCRPKLIHPARRSA